MNMIEPDIYNPGSTVVSLIKCNSQPLADITLSPLGALVHPPLRQLRQQRCCCFQQRSSAMTIGAFFGLLCGFTLSHTNTVFYKGQDALSTVQLTVSTVFSQLVTELKYVSELLNVSIVS